LGQTDKLTNKIQFSEVPQQENRHKKAYFLIASPAACKFDCKRTTADCQEKPFLKFLRSRGPSSIIFRGN